MPHATLPSPGLQALILCGPGESLSTFTSNPKDFPKALVPIANRPMVWYALDWCHRMGVSDITLITPPDSHTALEAALATHPALTSLPSPKPELLAPADLTQTTGTGELLRLPEVQKRITSDFVLLPCDLISEIDGSRFVQQWLTLNPLSTSSGRALGATKSTGVRKGGLGVFYPTQGLEGISHKKDETDFIATVPLPRAPVPAPQGSLRPDIETLVLSMPTDTLKDRLEEDGDTFLLRSRASQTYGRVKLKTKHRDAHVYILPKWVKDFIAANPKFESLSEDVLGWWAKAAWQKGLGEKIHLTSRNLGSNANTDEDLTGVDAQDDTDDPIDASALSSTKATPATTPVTPFASRVGPTTPIDTPTIPPLHAYIQPSTLPRPLLRRIDNPHALLSVSLYLAKQPPNPSNPLLHEHKIHPSATLGPQSRISAEDSLLAENVTVGSRAVVKESVVAANCAIGNNVRLTRCLLMDGVVIGDGVQMVGCIVGRRARIEGMKIAGEAAATGEGTDAPVTATPAGKGKSKRRVGADADGEDSKTKLTDCEIAPGFVVEAGTEAKGEKMMPFDTEDMGDLESGDEDEDDEEDDEDVDEEDDE